MLLNEMIEYVKQHFPDASESEIIRLLNMGSNDFSRKTQIMKDTASILITSDTRYYELTDAYTIIKGVSIEGSDGSMSPVDRAIGFPIKGA